MRSFSWTLLALLAACSGDKSEDTSGGATETDADADADADTDADSDADADVDDTGAVYTGQLSGKVVGPNGGPIEGVQMRLCQGACRTAWPESDGSFVFTELPPGWHALEAVPLATADDDTTVLAPVEIGDGEQHGLDASIHIYPFTTKTSLSGTKDIELEGGLTVHTDAAGFSVGSTSPSADPYLAGTKVDPAVAGIPFDGITGTVVGMWYLGNYDSHISPAWGFTLTDTLGLAEGAVVQLYVGNYEEATWTPAGTATVTGGALVSDADSGISILSTLLFVAP